MIGIHAWDTPDDIGVEEATTPDGEATPVRIIWERHGAVVLYSITTTEGNER